MIMQFYFETANSLEFRWIFAEWSIYPHTIGAFSLTHSHQGF